MKQQNGFTLVELAIALMVIGLLIGGVLKGQELIENARIVQTMRQLNDYDTAIMVFRNTYSAIPGDIRKTSRLPNCDDVLCNEPGTGDGRITTGNGEALRVWIHLGRTGLITGVHEDATYMYASPEAPYGSGHHVSLHALSAHVQPPEAGPYQTHLNRYVLRGAGYNNVRNIAIIDMKTDDGKPYGGSLQLYVNAGGAVCYDPATMEYVTDTSLVCYARIHSSSAN